MSGDMYHPHIHRYFTGLWWYLMSNNKRREITIKCDKAKKNTKSNEIIDIFLLPVKFK